MTDRHVIRTKDLGRRYGSRWVVQGLDLEVPRGSVFGFLGLNGAGKSTTMRMLLGLIRRHSGQATVLGYDPARQEVDIKQRVGYVAEDPAFYDWMRVGELCAFVAAYRKESWSTTRADELIHRFRIPCDVKIKNLSKGQRAKTALVLAMAFNPDLLLLDEPTSGLDPVARREFVEGMLAEYQESGRTIFVSSHLVNELSGLIDHVGIIHEGRLLRSGPVDQFVASVRRVRLTFDGPAPREIACDGLLQCRANGRDATVSVDGFDESKTIEQLKVYKPTRIEVESLNLEDAFVEFMSAAERGTT